MEGGMRVPMIARWPARIPAGKTCDELCTTMDILPTFCELTGASLPQRKIDGHDISSLLQGVDGARSPYKAFYYYRRRQLQAIRIGNLKYHLPLKQTFPNWANAEIKGKERPRKLVDLSTDIKEATDLSAAKPDEIKAFVEMASHITSELGNESVVGREQRQAKTLEDSAPMILKEN